MYEGTMKFLGRNLVHRQAGQNFNSEGIPDVPVEALQEVVANMFLHRDYFVSAPWRVLIFDDRIEIISPGALPNHLDVAKVRNGVACARNPVIVSHATKEIPYRGLGSGVKRVVQLFPSVEMINDIAAETFTTVFRFASGADRGSTDGVDAVNNGDAVNDAVNDAVKKLYDLIRNHPGLNGRKLASLMGRSEPTIDRQIRVLKSSDGMKIEFRGAPKTGGYYAL